MTLNQLLVNFRTSCNLALLIGLTDLVLGIIDAFFHHENPDCSQTTEDKTVSYLGFANSLVLLFFSTLILLVMLES